MYVINMDRVSPTIENVISFIGPQTFCGCIMLWACHGLSVDTMVSIVQSF